MAEAVSPSEDEQFDPEPFLRDSGALGEIGDLAALPSLLVLMAEGGGTGLTVMPVFPSLG